MTQKKSVPHEAPEVDQGPGVLVVGSGWAGHAARALAGRKQLAGLLSRGSPRSLELARELGAPHFDDVGRALATLGARRAIVAAGETRHGELLGALVAHGLDVLCAHPVAPSADEVAASSALGRAHGVKLLTDYTMRRTPEIEALVAAIGDDGPLLRLHVQSPGRWLPIALDLALLIGGPVREMESAWGWPHALTEQVRSSRAAFPPSLLLAHEAGVVTTWTPVTHMRTESPVRLVASMARAAWTLDLPDGGATRVAIGRAGCEERACVAPTTARGSAPILMAWARVALAFASGDYRGLATFDEEVERRRLWARIWRGAAP
ncbi:MAG: Gfo/Idh/MocA family oxidoreductase [Deltaproteobacteria bacterium]|nr:Gfo/Idh/MocA family oxidoreductase [Deltaproteobacteria bacterium]